MHTKESVPQDRHIELIDTQDFTDILRVVKSITIPSQNLEEMFERGMRFDGSSICGFARIQESDIRNAFRSLR